MVNPLYNEYDYKIPPKRLEQFQKYNEIIQWGRQNPTRFAELVFGIQFTDHQKWMILSSWVPSTVVWLCSRATGKSFMASVFLMLRSLLFANNNCYIMAPSGNQSQETFTKMEDIAKKNIASLTGTTDVFFNECMRMNSIADPFTHSKQGFTVSLYNGSTVNSLNSVAKNIVGIRQKNSAVLKQSRILLCKRLAKDRLIGLKEIKYKKLQNNKRAKSVKPKHNHYAW